MSAHAPRARSTQRPRPLDICCVLNPRAAHAKSAGVKRALHAALRARGLRHRVVLTRPGAGAAAWADRVVRSALASGCRRFVVAGGDGTVSLAAAALVRTARRFPSATLGIVPTGTANVLALDLALPLDPDEAIALALDGGHARPIDAMLAGERAIFTQAGVGLDAQMIRHTSRDARIRHGRLAYAVAFVRRALTHRPGRFELEIDGRKHRFRAWQVVVANIGTLGAPPFTWGPGIDPSDGVLDVCVFPARTLRDLLSLVPRLLLRRSHAVHARCFRARERVVIRSRGSMLVQGDGEIIGRTPLTLEVLTRAVRVCVQPPPGASEAHGRNGRRSRAESAAPDSRPGEGPWPAEAVVADVGTMVARRGRRRHGGWRRARTVLAALDAALFLRVNALELGGFADRSLVLVSRVMHYGEGWAVVAAGLLAYDFVDALRATGTALPVLWLTMLTVNFPLKRLFRRRRPFRAYVHARVVGPEPADSSFPSGHTAAGFAGALLFSAYLPEAAPAFYGLAALVGFSRIYLGVHYPGDVIAGAAFGTALAAGFTWLLRAGLGALLK